MAAFESQVLLSALATVASAAVTVGTTPGLFEGPVPSDAPETGIAAVGSHAESSASTRAPAAASPLLDENTIDAPVPPAEASVQTAGNIGGGASSHAIPLSVVGFFAFNAMLGVFLQVVMDGGVFRSDARNREEWEKLSEAPIFAVSRPVSV